MSARRSSAGVLLALVLLAPALAPAFANEESEKLIKEGEGHYLKKAYKEALALFEKALKADPASAKAQAMIAGALSSLGDDKAAFAAYDKALKLDDPPGRVTVWVHTEKGLYYGQKGDLGLSVASFKKALEYDPEDYFALKNLGVTYAHQKKWKEAVDCFEKSLASNPNQPQLKDWIADARKQGGLPEPKAEPRPEPKRDKPAEGGREPRAARGDAAPGDASFELPTAGGWATSADLKTLIVSVPSRAELVFYDTLKLKEAKRVSVDFQPGQLAVQGKTLFATVRGGSQVHALDLETGKAQKAIKVPGDPIAEIACNRAKGSVYVSTTKEEVYAIDPKTFAVTRTDVKGQLLAVDPGAAAFLYVASTASPGKTPVKKLQLKGKELPSVAVNKSAALDGRALHVSPDGKRLVVSGASGYQADGADAQAGSAAVFSTDDLVTSLGQIEVGSAPECIVFHPTIAAGVALGAGGELVQFHGRSLVPVKTTSVEASRTAKDLGWVAFVSRGARVAVWRPGDSGTKESGRLAFFALELTADEKAALDKAYGPEPR